MYRADDGRLYFENLDGSYIYLPIGAEGEKMASQQDYINQVRQANKKVWDGINELVELQKQWNALDYGNTLVDPTGALTAAEIGAVVFDTANAMVAVQAAGHSANQAKLL